MGNRFCVVISKEHCTYPATFGDRENAVEFFEKLDCEMLVKGEHYTIVLIDMMTGESLRESGN